MLLNPSHVLQFHLLHFHRPPFLPILLPPVLCLLEQHINKRLHLSCTYCHHIPCHPPFAIPLTLILLFRYGRKPKVQNPPSRMKTLSFVLQWWS